jgi:hypothetical protein
MTPENARNRRTCIVVLPKIDQFYDMIEKEKKKNKDHFFSLYKSKRLLRFFLCLFLKVNN